MAEQVPWSDDTDAIISDLEEKISGKYSVSLRDLLLNPTEYAGKPDTKAKVEGIKADVNGYISQLLASLSDEQEAFRKDLEHANAQYQKVNDSISARSKASGIPYIYPFAVNRDVNADETVVIDEYDESIGSLIDRFLKVSNYVADISATYKTYKIGAWLFSGNRAYSIAVNPPMSPVLTLETSSAEISSMLDEILQQ